MGANCGIPGEKPGTKVDWHDLDRDYRDGLHRGLSFDRQYHRPDRGIGAACHVDPEGAGHLGTQRWPQAPEPDAERRAHPAADHVWDDPARKIDRSPALAGAIWLSF